jgi:hypothetical protein
MFQLRSFVVPLIMTDEPGRIRMEVAVTYLNVQLEGLRRITMKIS